MNQTPPRPGTAGQAPHVNDPSSWPNQGYGWYVTFILLLGYTFSFVDRQVLNLLVEPIRLDLGISDTQISFLQGLAFVITYVAMSIPIGRLVDKFNRVRIMIGGIIVWSVTTIGCGLAGNYSQLVAARLGVGAGEAAMTPAAWSVLADYFHPDKLARPISVYLMGPYLGAGIAMIAGAEVLDWTRNVDSLTLPLLGTVAAWQFTFIAVGVPGFLIAALFLTVREPVRTGRDEVGLDVPPWGEVWGFMWQHKRIYLALHLGVPFLVVMLYGLQGWVPTVLVRVYEWDLAQAGRIYGIIALVAGSAGVLTGPFVAKLLTRWQRDDAAILIAVAGALMATVFLLLLPMQREATLALVGIAGASFSVTLPLALTGTAIQLVTPNAMRGVVNGTYVVLTNIIGLALGSFLVAASTDYVFGDPAAVAKSLGLVAMVMGPIAVILLMAGAKPYAARLQSLRAE